MSALDIENKLLENYLKLLHGFTPDFKLALIERLSKSMQSSNQTEKRDVRDLYGALDSKQTADELILEIKSSRSFNRERAQL